MTFAELGLRPELVRAVGGAGYTTPTPIQERGIPVALDGRDLIACAQTGTGKTAAFLLPILHRLAGGPPARRPRALVVTPTRELAAQIGEMAEQYGAHLRLRSAVIFGGVGMEPQTRRLRRGLDLVIATPGRLLDHLRQGHAQLDHIETVVLDPASLLVNREAKQRKTDRIDAKKMVRALLAHDARDAHPCAVAPCCVCPADGGHALSVAST
jgi:ATP-dependent RNA helicase RhlE